MSALAPPITKLPDEIFLMVLEHIPPDLYPSLARVSRRFHFCVTPRLYHSIYYPGPHYVKCDYPKQHRYSRIFGISELYRTLQSSPSMASLIKEAWLEWRHDHMGINHSMRLVTNSLPSSIETLHLSSPGAVAPNLSAVVTSLNMHVLGLTINGSRLMSVGKLFTVFSMPRLVHLTFHGAVIWENLAWTPNQSAARYSTSTVEFLSFDKSVPLNNSLVELLKWPKRLKSFHAIVSSSDSLVRWDPDWGDERPYKDMSDFLQIVELGAPELQEIFVSGDYFTFDRIVNLNAFTSLTRVALPLRSLMNAEIYGDTTDFPDPFPPKLKVLQIELPSQWDPKRYGDIHRDTAMWFCETAKRKESRYPAFESCILWPVEDMSDIELDGDVFFPSLEEADIEICLSHEFNDTIFSVRVI